MKIYLISHYCEALLMNLNIYNNTINESFIDNDVKITLSSK